MQPLLYCELSPWYRLIDPLDEHREEAGVYLEALLGAEVPLTGTLLELGAGAGNNAYYLKRNFSCTLTDISNEMLGLSRDINPECEHITADMRTLRLGRQFDAVFVHDAIAYMLTEADLQQALETAFVHTRPGGAAIVAPDCFRDSFRATQQTFGRASAEEDRELHCLEWTWDPEPGDSTYVVDYAFLLREGKAMKAVHDQHVEGLFARTTWLTLLAKAGFAASSMGRPLGDGSVDEVFLCRRP